MAVGHRVTRKLESPSMMTFLYGVIVLFAIAAVVLEVVGLDVIAGLIGGYVVFFVVVAIVAHGIIWTLRTVS